jgi:hypothetical protein
MKSGEKLTMLPLLIANNIYLVMRALALRLSRGVLGRL